MKDSQTLLAEGTPIQVHGKIGTVIKAELVRDQFGLPIALHTVELTHKIDTSFANRQKIVALKKPVIQQVNYSFITVRNEKIA